MSGALSTGITPIMLDSVTYTAISGTPESIMKASKKSHNPSKRHHWQQVHKHDAAALAPLKASVESPLVPSTAAAARDTVQSASSTQHAAVCHVCKEAKEERKDLMTDLNSELAVDSVLLSLVGIAALVTKLEAMGPRTGDVFAHAFLFLLVAYSVRICVNGVREAFPKLAMIFGKKPIPESDGVSPWIRLAMRVVSASIRAGALIVASKVAPAAFEWGAAMRIPEQVLQVLEFLHSGLEYVGWGTLAITVVADLTVFVRKVVTPFNAGGAHHVSVPA